MRILERIIPPGLPDHSRRTLRLDTLANIAYGAVAAGGPATAAVILKKHFNTDDVAVALLYSAGAVGLLLTPVATRVVRRTGAPRYLFAVGSASALFLGVAGFLSSSLLFALALSGSYILANLVHPATTRIYRQNYPTAVRGALVALVRAAANSSFALVGFLIGRLLEANPLHYRWFYPVLGAGMLLGAAFYRRIRVRREEDTNEASPGVRTWVVYRDILLGDKRYSFLMLAWSIFGFSNLMVEPVRAIYVADSRYLINAGYLESLLILIIIPQVAVVATLWIWGRLLDKYPVTTLRVWLQLLGVLNLIVFIYAPDLEWLYFASVIRGVQMSGAQLTWTLVMMEFAPRSRVSEYGAIHQVLAGSRTLVAPYIAALLVAAIGPRGAFGVGIAMILVSVVAFLLFDRITANWPVPADAPQPKRRRG